MNCRGGHANVVSHQTLVSVLDSQRKSERTTKKFPRMFSSLVFIATTPAWWLIHECSAKQNKSLWNSCAYDGSVTLSLQPQLCSHMKQCALRLGKTNLCNHLIVPPLSSLGKVRATHSTNYFQGYYKSLEQRSRCCNTQNENIHNVEIYKRRSIPDVSGTSTEINSHTIFSRKLLKSLQNGQWVSFYINQATPQQQFANSPWSVVDNC